jgi:hypothetical protein
LGRGEEETAGRGVYSGEEKERVWQEKMERRAEKKQRDAEEKERVWQEKMER